MTFTVYIAEGDDVTFDADINQDTGEGLLSVTVSDGQHYEDIPFSVVGDDFAVSAEPVIDGRFYIKCNLDALILFIVAGSRADQR